MPIYGYHCRSCGEEFEVWQRMSDEPVAACPACGGEGVRLFFPAGIVFKGTGFYKTDSRVAEEKRSPAPAAGDKKADGSDGGAKPPADGKQPEAKPADAKPAAAGSSPPGPSSPAPEKG